MPLFKISNRVDNRSWGSRKGWATADSASEDSASDCSFSRLAKHMRRSNPARVRKSETIPSTSFSNNLVAKALSQITERVLSGDRQRKKGNLYLRWALPFLLRLARRSLPKKVSGKPHSGIRMLHHQKANIFRPLFTASGDASY
jgi:hypothetical protein